MVSIQIRRNPEDKERLLRGLVPPSLIGSRKLIY